MTWDIGNAIRGIPWDRCSHPFSPARRSFISHGIRHGRTKRNAGLTGHDFEDRTTRLGIIVEQSFRSNGEDSWEKSSSLTIDLLNRKWSPRIPTVTRILLYSVFRKDCFCSIAACLDMLRWCSRVEVVPAFREIFSFHRRYVCFLFSSFQILLQHEREVIRSYSALEAEFWTTNRGCFMLNSNDILCTRSLVNFDWKNTLFAFRRILLHALIVSTATESFRTLHVHTFRRGNDDEHIKMAVSSFLRNRWYFRRKCIVFY